MIAKADLGIEQVLLDEIIELARQYQVEKLILFGSRARGDYKKKSDIDLAFYGGEASRFILAVDEDTHTLLEFDIINMNGAVQEALRESINKEGVLLYEKI